MPGLINIAKKHLSLWITTKIIWGLYTFFNVWFFLKWRMYNNYNSYDYLVFIIGYLLVYLIIEALNHLTSKNFFRALISITLTASYYLVGKYHFRVTAGFDYSLLAENFFEIFNEASANVIFSTLKPKDVYETVFIFILLTALHIRFKIFNLKKPIQFKKSIGFFIAYTLLVRVTPYSFDEISYTYKTFQNFYIHEYEPSSFTKEEQLGPHLFKKKIISNFKKSRPHIFIVMIESFNSLYVEQKTKQNKEITPVFNSLIKEGVYIDDFYGNSIQTIKGQFSTFCSRDPLVNGKSSYELSGKKLNCLPDLLTNLNYDTYFHKCFNSLSFDNTGQFMKEIGFNHILHTDTSMLTATQKKEMIWGWGVQDDFSYIQFLDNFEKIKDNKKPLFSIIHTVSHHMRFDHIPPKQRHLFHNTQNRNEIFLNSLHLSDRYLGVFIQELKKRKLYDNSLILITGDHSFPAGEHGFFHNEISYQQEFFKTPLVMIWKNHLKPKRISEKTFSQVDIAPTIIDLLGENLEMNGIGSSIFSNTNQFAHLVQPYHGMYLGVVKYPFKFIWERRTGREFFFDLKNDPKEKRNIKKHPLKESYREEIGKILYNDEFLKDHFSR